MSSGQAEFAKLTAAQTGESGVEAGQMFGKVCLKVGGKAFAAQQNDLLAFKLTGADHAAALKEEGARLWDPSGAGRPMKEWVAIPATANGNFSRYCDAAKAYVKG